MSVRRAAGWGWPLLLALFAPSAARMARADWPQILGPNRDGKSTENVALAADILEADDRIAWRHPVGSGFAGPAVAGDRCFLHHRRDDQAILECLSRASGERLWRVEHVCRYVDKFGFDDGPRAVPVVAEGAVVTLGPDGLLQCREERDGALRWEKDLRRIYGMDGGFFGVAASPVVHRGKVMAMTGCEGGPVSAAFDLSSGEELWRSVAGEADCASPVVAEIGERQQFIAFARDGILALACDDGTVLHRERLRSPIHASVNAATPIVAGDEVFFSACYDTGAGVWSVGDEGVWRNVWKREGSLDCHYASPVVHGGHLYGFHGRQEQGQEFRCVAWKDGVVRWSSHSLGRAGSVIFADRKLLVLGERGELIALACDPAKEQVLYRIQILGAGSRPLPALSRGHFFARDKRQLVCVDLRERDSEESPR